MDKLDGKTFDVVKDNIEKMKEIFPDIFTEGKIDMDKFMLNLGEHVEKDKERYEFTWKGKTEAIQLAQKQITGTLRPYKEESVNWDTTQNLYIEGDNLEVLRVLQNSYRNKVKMIYIDPPYNTGKDFVYKDNFHDNVTNYKEKMGDIYKSNALTNGRFHTDWLNMMYPRLKVAKNLLKADGVIFISIDDNEVANLKKMCDEIFGEENFITEIIWEKKFSPQNDAKYFSLNHEQLLCYAKDKTKFNRNLLPMTEEQKARYKNPDNDPRGPWQSDNLTVATYNSDYDYPIKTPSGKTVEPVEGRCWNTSKTRMNELINDNRIWFGPNGKNTPRIKRFLSDVQQGRVPISIWYHKEVGHTQSASQDLKKLFGNKKYFDFPKPVNLIKKAIYLGTNENDIVLDFFAGSSTTAQAVFELNVEEYKNRKFIMVQLDEPLDEKSDGYKNGYRTISDISKDRIRLAGKKVFEEIKGNEYIRKVDIGFKAFKLDETNLQKWDEESFDLEQDLLNMIDPVKEGRTQEDVVYEVLLKYGVDLTIPIEKKNIAGKSVYDVGMGYLLICLERDITLDIIEQIAEINPARVVFYDEGFKDDTVRTNAQQILKRHNVEDIRVI
ncbi:site-specific DNA-methyltransferase [Virgibacillus phasianinus]|uniref:Site-specific DNA-methyltransferase n=1 Tax=Virgibacillus phasianinus TaxID=2017483 RepID=A0A220U7X6_9BACI|nr:site-specific DNA-methyltransferase [Virgibacillus phasianinus]ASK64228.1 site-specific DNA-methyltransferase [Virgibacillus phasianinus]